jgi:hypothetical protein
MIGRRWVQAGGGAGIAAFIVITAGFSTNGSLPASNASATQIANYLTSHRSSVLVGTALTVVAAGLILWFAGTLARLLHARDQHSPLGLIVLGAGVGMAVITSLDSLTLTALEFLSKQGGLTDPAVTRTFYDLQNGIIMPGAFGCIAAVMLAAIGASAVRRIFAAPWLGWLSFLFAALAVTGSLVGLTSTSGGTSAFGFMPAVGSGVILLISSIFMVRDSAAGIVPAPTPMAATATG